MHSDGSRCSGDSGWPLSRGWWAAGSGCNQSVGQSRWVLGPTDWLWDAEYCESNRDDAQGKVTSELCAGELALVKRRLQWTLVLSL